MRHEIAGNTAGEQQFDGAVGVVIRPADGLQVELFVQGAEDVERNLIFAGDADHHHLPAYAGAAMAVFSSSIDPAASMAISTPRPRV